ncbi:MAG: hypothetical protein DRJ31_08815 [Candidatus Methanomethylicota archaeon]|uniref:Uncharacterized protein n=1 Tax=Thermoproteota archaeon TaxID=2056631 RepID=A0A497EKH2_9CREN|nr:MAG: hypothetical protein DRJ31_08815 [Candidatus Verstraetearchaeota archaeon]
MVKVKLLGSLAKGVGREVDIKIEGEIKVRDLIEKFRGKNRELYPENPNIIVLVNGIEIGVLNKLDTTIKNEDEVILLPAAHGGAEVHVRAYLVEPHPNILDELNEIRKKTNAIVQIVDPSCVASLDHIRLIAFQTWEAMKNDELMAEKPEIDLLMRFALTDQINLAIERCGYKGLKSILIVFGLKKDVEKAEVILKKEFKLNPFHPIADSKEILEMFEIERKELESVSSDYDPITSILVERASLLKPKRD